jgi:NAD(P)-dependent dehydrogenase (short-subunit alcohol dehydrogenase family)
MAKTVLISGCSSGIGRMTAELFAARGWNVAATARDATPLASWLTGANVIALQLDVTDEASIASAVATAARRFGAIDVLVNNAGYGLFGPLEGSAPAQFEAQFRTNVFGIVSMIRAVLPGMRERRSGTVVNVGSLAGRIAMPFATGYNATKFAVEGLSESLRYELKLHGILVKIVEPAHFKTGFFERSLQSTDHPAYRDAYKNYMGWVRHEDSKSPGPRAVAETILRAAGDSSGRLRYPVKAGLIVTARALLPDALWRAFMGAGMTRRPPGPAV